MEISILGLALGLMLIVVTLYVLQFFGVNLWSKAAVAFVRMAVGLALTGVFLYFLLSWNSLLANLLWVLVMALVSAFVVVKKGRLRHQRMVLPVMVGLICGSIVVGLYFLFFVLGLRNPFDTRYFVPVIGIALGSMVSLDAQALSIYYAGLAHKGQLYNYLRGNGATHREALSYFVRRAMQRVSIPFIQQMGGMMLTVTPLILWVMVLNGIPLFTSIAFQVAAVGLMFCATVVSLLTSLFIARRYSFDEYDKIKAMGDNF